MRRLRFQISELAAEAIDLPSLKLRGTAAGIDDAGLTYSPSVSGVNLDCSLTFGIYVVDELRYAATKEGASIEFIVNCTDAMRNVFLALDRAIYSTEN